MQVSECLSGLGGVEVLKIQKPGVPRRGQRLYFRMKHGEYTGTQGMWQTTSSGMAGSCGQEEILEMLHSRHEEKHHGNLDPGCRCPAHRLENAHTELSVLQ